MLSPRQMDKQLIKINDSMRKIQELVDNEIKNPEDMMLVCSALMAVTRNMYVVSLGATDAAKMFQAVSDSFYAIEDLMDHFRSVEKPTFH
jgi:N-acetylneuraminic acid mutarotase